MARLRRVLGADDTSTGLVGRMGGEDGGGCRGTNESFPVDDKPAGLLHYTKRNERCFVNVVLLDKEEFGD